jgi:hypothetical protein
MTCAVVGNATIPVSMGLNRSDRMASARTIRPLAVSEVAFALLRGAAPFVQAVHESGVSLAIAGRPGLCYLNAPGNGLLPLHIVVRQRDLAWLFNELQDGDPTEIRISLDLEGVRVFRLALAPADLQAPQPRSAVDQVGAWLRLRCEPCGLGVPAADAISADGLVRRTLGAVAAGPANAGPALRALIGRGAGSTPAGDDMLVGALAHAFASGLHHAPLIGAMRALMPEFERLTTAASATYLCAAVRGDFSGDLLAFARALAQPPAERALHRALRVAEHGATSGVDTLLGFVAAHEAARED